MGYASVSRLDAGLIPLIDIGPLRCGSAPDDVARALHRASAEIGFVYVVNHGIDIGFLDRTRATALEFFRQPLDDKLKVSISDKHRGFLQMGAAKMHDGARPDLKESFVWGLEDASGRAPDDHALRGNNRWPPAMPAMRTAALRFLEESDRVARHLLAGFALGLGLQRNFFLRTSSQPMSRAAFTYYPPQPAALGPDQFGVAPHTDFGVLTVLCQDDVGGLQVRHANGTWVEAPPIPGSLVINVGDLLSRWTHGVYRSTPHRVVNASGRERLSLVLAFDPDPDTRIDARDVFPDCEPSEPAIACGDYLTWRFRKAFDYRKTQATDGDTP
jgi:isopenicillin N synthase-like dioxygenase